MEADGQESDRVDRFVKAYIRNHKIPGCAIMVRHKGKVVTRAYGKANLEHNVDVTRGTLFQSGSVGKQFTAMGVMLLVEKGKLSLDEPVSKYLKDDLKVPDTWSGITVRHLLTHTSGLGDYPQWITYREYYDDKGLLDMITMERLCYTPGERFEYSNLGYVTLGILITRVSGEFYGDFLKKRVFDRLGMEHTRVISDQDIIPNRAAGYFNDEGDLKNQEWVSPTFNSTADGTLYFTVGDLAKWDKALESGKLLRKASYLEMWTPFKLNDGRTTRYGFGWFIDNPNAGHRILWHDGRWQGFSACIARYPEDRFTVVALCNLRDAETGCIADRIAGFYIPGLTPRARLKSPTR
jgi:CubicO group peptidase (beta-lactamase class C family)